MIDPRKDEQWKSGYDAAMLHIVLVGKMKREYVRGYECGKAVLAAQKRNAERR